MFSGPINKWINARRRLGHGLFYFLLLWLTTLLFLSLFTLLVKNQLKNEERRDAEQKVNRYVARTFPAGLSFSTFKRDGGTITLQGLSFVRMVNGPEQVFFGGDQGEEQVDFRRLVEFDPTQTGVWIDGPGQARWTILSRRMGDGLFFQAGKKSDRSYRLYLRIRTFCFWASGVSFFLCLLAVSLLSRLTYSPIRRVAREIAALPASGTRGDLPVHIDDNRDLKELYSRINRLIEQNRQLIVEMQGSLDNVAHDLRTPMTRLRSVAEYALQAKPDPELYREALSDCLEESDRVLSMLKIMMSVAEAESGTMQLDMQQLNLKEMLEDVLSLYEYSADEMGIDIRPELEEDLWVLGDTTRLSQVWSNLLDNALKYSYEGGQVEVRLYQEGDAMVVSFSDSGMGISASEMTRIWDRLYRGDRSRTKPGLGLGLNFVKAVVEAHGGRVSVSSKLQEGSIFTVRLKTVDSG